MATSTQETVRSRSVIPNAGHSSRVASDISTYVGHYSEGSGASEDRARTSHATEIAQSYYQVATDFYEYGWGESFHFAPIVGDSSLKECIAEFERDIARELSARPGMKLLDAGCGVGGPARAIAAFSGVNITGVTISDYQVQRAKTLTHQANMDDKCTFSQGDFCNMDKIPNDSFDGAYALEATCHAKSPVDVYREVYRVLKPGGVFVDVTWIMTDKYDQTNPDQLQIKNGILVGNGLPELRSQQEVLDAMKRAGFEITTYKDAAKDGDLPWYVFLSGKNCMSLENFRMSIVGRWCTHAFLYILETLRIAPPGSCEVHSVLMTAATSLVAAGKLDIFTPSFRVVAKKPNL